MNTYNSSLGGSRTHDLGWSLGCPLTTAEVSPILPRFLYSLLYLLGNPVTSSTCCGSVIVKSTVDVVEDRLWMVVDVDRDQ